MELKICIALIIIAIIVELLFYGCLNDTKLAEIQKYKYLVSNGQRYETSQMVDITRDYVHNKDTFIITMKDGTKIYINDYSLTNDEGGN